MTIPRWLGIPRRSAGAGHRIPFDERPCSKQTVMSRAQEVSADPKQILNGTVHRQEALRAPCAGRTRSASGSTKPSGCRCSLWRFGWRSSRRKTPSGLPPLFKACLPHYPAPVAARQSAVNGFRQAPLCAGGTGLIRIFSDTDLSGMSFSTSGSSWPLSMRRAGLYVSNISGDDVERIRAGGGIGAGPTSPQL